MAGKPLARYFQKGQAPVGRMTSLGAADTGGGQIGNALMVGAANLDAIAKRDEDYWVQKALSEYDRKSSTKWNEAVNGVGEDEVPGFNNRFQGALNDDRNEYLRTAPSKRAARKFELGSAKYRNNYDKRGQAFEITQKFNSRSRTIRKEADNLGQSAMRNNGVQPYSPHTIMVPPGTLASQLSKSTKHFYVSRKYDPKTKTYSKEGWNSKYYSPRDFADGVHMVDKSKGVVISREVVNRLDWVTEQFGRGKLQINSGYRSPASNLKRASSGAHGPHTKGTSIDIQVRDLPQGEKNRLYSLLKAAGFNAFGFGRGALHAEIRPGKGKGRGGDHEWVYNGQAKYDLVPVVHNGKITGAGTSWASANQYPYLPMLKMTGRMETGTHNLVEASAKIANDTNGSRSYGIFGINSGTGKGGSSARLFADSNPDLKLTGRPGSPEFDARWMELAKKQPKKLIEAQIRHHEKHVVRPAQRHLVAFGHGKLSNDPRAIAFVADMVGQYGVKGAEKHVAAAAGSKTVEQFIEASSTSMRARLDRDFASYLKGSPANRRGLLNRIDRRAKYSLTLSNGNGSPITGNVPAWNGPIPDIANVPGYQDRMKRLGSMVDTMGGTPSQRRAIKDQMRRQIVRNWLSSIAQTNPSAAMAALHSGIYDDSITMEDQAGIVNGAQAGWKSYENEIRRGHRTLMANLSAETKSIIADEVASLRKTGNGTGRLTDAHKAQMTDAERETLDLAKFEHSITKEINGAREHELDGILEELTPQGEGFATEQKKYDYAKKLIDARRKHIQNDSAGYVVANNATAAEFWKAAMASGNPQIVQSAIRTIREVQKELGVPAKYRRSITQSSMDNNEKLLKADTAEKAFSNFSQMRAIYGHEFDAVLGDMEKQGGQKGWRAVNKMMDSGQMLLAKSLSRVVHGGEFHDDARHAITIAGNGMSPIAKSILNGRIKRMEIKGILPSGKSDDTSETRKEIAGRTIGDAFINAPSVLGSVIEAADSYYAETATLGAPLDAKKYEEALRVVSGGLLSHNGSESNGEGVFVPPVPGMTKTQFSRILDEVRDGDIKGAYIGYAQDPDEVTVSMLKNRLQLSSAGNGIYHLRYPGAGLARNAAGLPYEFNLGKLLPELGKRAAKRSSKPTYFDAGGWTAEAWEPGGPMHGKPGKPE